MKTSEEIFNELTQEIAHLEAMNELLSTYVTEAMENDRQSFILQDFVHAMGEKIRILNQKASLLSPVIMGKRSV